MTAPWPTVRLGDLVEIKHGFAFKGEHFTEVPNENVLLTPGNFRIGGGYKGEKLKYYTGAVDDEYVLREGDLFVTMTDLSKAADTLGFPALVPHEPGRNFLHNQRLGRVLLKNKDQLDLRYLYFLLCSQSYRNEVLASVTGTTVKHTSPKKIAAFTFALPPLPEQQRIARILGVLDDKIALNRGMNETLEATARAIFQSWFVDFNPVGAKAEGKHPFGMDSETAALFPDEFEESEMGKMPKGWRIEQIKNLTSSIQYGLTQSASKEKVGPHFLRITDIQGGRVNWSEVPYCVIASDDVERYRIRSGDIFVARTGASTGENIYISEAPEAVFASYLVRFQFENQGIARVVGAFMRTDDYFNFVAGAIGGSAQPNASAQVLASASLAVPTLPIAQKFYELIKPLDRQKYINDCESVLLNAIRDALLPKLMSGHLSPSKKL